MRKMAALLLALASWPSLACQAQGAGASEDGRASATIVEPLRIRFVNDLSFGAVSVGRNAGGEVAISPTASGAAYSGSVGPHCTSGSECLPHPARIAVSGEPGRTYRVQMPASVTARGRDTGQVLNVSALVMASRNRPGADRGGALDQEGSDRIEIGGVLEVPAATHADIFRADLAISVSYD